MRLGHWDSSRRKYVLYQNAEQHTADCDRFTFESIPRRVFLDTNVINVLVKHRAHVFDHEPIPLETESTLATDIEALMQVFYVGTRATWDILASQRTLDELSRTRNSTLREDLLEYALGFVDRDLCDEPQVRRRFRAPGDRRAVRGCPTGLA